MPVMDGLQATRLIRSFEKTGSWEEAVKAGLEMEAASHQVEETRKRVPIIAVSQINLYTTLIHQTSNYSKTRKKILVIFSLIDKILCVQMTANTVSESAEECYANGMDSFVSKPITLQTLRHCLQNYLV